MKCMKDIFVEQIQNYDSGVFANEGQYAEYRVMISQNGTLTSELVAGGTDFTLTFAYASGVLSVTASENYGYYVFECTVLDNDFHN